VRRARDPLAAHNERVKLASGFCNAVAIGLIGFALLRPLVETTLILDLPLILKVGIGLVFHGIAHYILTYLEREVRDDPA